MEISVVKDFLAEEAVHQFLRFVTVELGNLILTEVEPVAQQALEVIRKRLWGFWRWRDVILNGLSLYPFPEIGFAQQPKLVLPYSSPGGGIDGLAVLAVRDHGI